MSQPIREASQDAVFEQVVALYDLTDDVVNVIGMSTSLDRAHWLEKAKPIIETSNHSIDVLCQMVTEIERGEVTLNEEKKRAMVEAFNSIFAAIDQFKRVV